MSISWRTGGNGGTCREEDKGGGGAAAAAAAAKLMVGALRLGFAGKRSAVAVAAGLHSLHSLSARAAVSPTPDTQAGEGVRCDGKHGADDRDHTTTTSTSACTATTSGPRTSDEDGDEDGGDDELAGASSMTTLAVVAGPVFACCVRSSTGPHHDRYRCALFACC